MFVQRSLLTRRIRQMEKNKNVTSVYFFFFKHDDNCVTCMYASIQYATRINVIFVSADLDTNKTLHTSDVLNVGHKTKSALTAIYSDNNNMTIV